MFHIGRMTRTQTRKGKRNNDNLFKKTVGMRSHNARGSTRSNRRMKNAENLAAWHNQIKNVLKQQQRESELLGISGRAHSAFHGNNNSNLPAHASKAQRNVATYRRLMSELASLEGRGHLSNANKTRMRNLRHAVKEYAPNLQLGGARSKPRGVTFANREGPTLGKLLPVLSRYVDEPVNKIKVVFDPATNARNGLSKKQAVQSLVMEALHKYKNAPDSVQKRDDEAIMKAAARITVPTGVVGYVGSWRNSTRRNRNNRNNRNNNNMNGGGCGCSGGTVAPLFPTA